MKFLADMGVARSTVAWLRGAGHDAVHLVERGLQRAPDGEVLALAAAEGRVLLTFDLDFGHLLAWSRGSTPSVVVFRVSAARPENVNAQLEHVVRDHASDLTSGAIVVVEDERRRVRKLPIGAP